MQGWEKYRDEWCCEARWLIDNGIMSKTAYHKHCQRSNITVVRRGHYTEPALVRFKTMAERIKKQINEFVGGNIEDILERQEKSLLVKKLEEHEMQCKHLESYDYFSKLTDRNGKLLKEEQVRKMWNSSKIMLAIDSVLEIHKRVGHGVRRQGFSMTKEFDAFVRAIDYELVGYENSLPTTSRRLMNKYKEWKEQGDVVFVHGLLGQEGNRTKNVEDVEAIKALVSELVAKGNQLSDVMIEQILATAGILVDRRRIGEIRRENEMVNAPQRKGMKHYDNTYKMQADRRRPSQPMLMWVSDGWDAELYYDNGKSKYNRLNIVMVIDAYNDYIMGYAIGERECGELIIEAYRDAIRHAEALFGRALMPWQIMSDNYAKAMLTPYYTAICKQYTPARVGNAKQKVIEQYFRTIQSKLQLLPNYSGHNITAKKQLNDDFMNLNAKQGLIPDRDGVVMQLQALVEVERAERRAALLEAWNSRDEEMVLALDRGKYLVQYGERSRGNMLTPNGLKLIREGKEYKYECLDIRMREMRGEKWTICYDMKNMNEVVALSEDSRVRFVLEAKEKVAMCIAEVTERDVEILQKIKGFNSNLSHHVMQKRLKHQELAEGYVAKHQLEGTLAGRLLVDAKGQHKDLKTEERLRIKKAMQEAEPVEVEEEIMEEKIEKEIRQRQSIYSKF